MMAPSRSSGQTFEPERAEVEQLGARLAGTRQAPATKVLGPIAQLGDQEPLYAAAAILVIAAAVRRDPRLGVAAVRVGAAVALSDAMKSAAKKLVKRSRPRALAEGRGYRREAGGSNEKAEQSFPSGHVAATLAAARALARVYPASRGPGLAVAFCLGVVRVIEGEHWPSDVAAGALIGLAAEAGSGAIIGAVLTRTCNSLDL